MILLNSAMILAVAALIASTASLVWSIRRKP